MTAPVPASRQTPTGKPLVEGYQVLITITANPSVDFWEKTVTPPALDGGDEIDITTQLNNTYRTTYPQRLIGLGELSATVAYDAAALSEIESLINQNTTITVKFPDGSQLAFYGYLKSFEPQELSRGSQPEANITIVPTNIDPVTLQEEGPVYVPYTET